MIIDDMQDIASVSLVHAAAVLYRFRHICCAVHQHNAHLPHHKHATAQLHSSNSGQDRHAPNPTLSAFERFIAAFTITRVARISCSSRGSTPGRTDGGRNATPVGAITNPSGSAAPPGSIALAGGA
jgi:hypothetical protein